MVLIMVCDSQLFLKPYISDVQLSVQLSVELSIQREIFEVGREPLHFKKTILKFYWPSVLAYLSHVLVMMYLS